MEIRDPIHGTIVVSAIERTVVDSIYFQRLRQVKQLGFSELTFPGASHTRFLHSLGCMHLAGLAFDSALRDASWLQPDDAQRLRQLIRLAALCHDLGHPPLSHTSELLLPPGHTLQIPFVPQLSDGESGSHEHFTLLLLLGSELAHILDDAGRSLDITARDVAGLLHGDVDAPAERYLASGRDLQPLLGALVSSELDVDRMDYLLRDSYYTGVSYGKYDCDWLLSHLCHVQDESGAVHLGLDERAIFTFDDFLLSRHHMFLMVYFHRKTVCFDHMLWQFYREFPQAVQIPADPEQYAELDDGTVWRALRAHRKLSPWAEGILTRRPLSLAAESTTQVREPIPQLLERLDESGVRYLHVTSKGALSKYGERESGRSLRVRRQPVFGAPVWLPLAEATQLYARYRETTLLERVYVAREDVERAGRWLEELRNRPWI